MTDHSYQHYYKAYWRAVRLGRLRAARYAHDLAHLAAVSPQMAMLQRMYDRLILDKLG